MLLALAGPASASTAPTIRLYAKTTRSTFTDPSGHPILAHVPSPASGSVLTNTGSEALGTPTHHSRAESASTNIVCFVTQAPAAWCYGQVAIAGSMLLANRFAANLASSNPFATIPINGGSGRFAGARGSIHTTSVGTAGGVELTIRYSTRSRPRTKYGPARAAS